MGKFSDFSRGLTQKRWIQILRKAGNASRWPIRFFSVSPASLVLPRSPRIEFSFNPKSQDKVKNKGEKSEIIWVNFQISRGV